jgi:membrane fusion protein (multidrug efflux system)
MKKSRIFILFAFVATLIVLGAFRLYNNKRIIDAKAAPRIEVNTAVPVRIAAVVERQSADSLELSGTFEARQELPLTAQTQGAITVLTIEEGDQVAKGAVIARIDNAAVQANLQTARIALAKAIKDQERYQRLAGAGAVSQKQFEDVSLNVENARANVAAIEQQLRYTVVRAPMSGTVTDVRVEAGSFATPGTQIARVIDISRLKLVIKVPESEIVRLRKGQPVSITTDVYPGETFSGSVSVLGVKADQGRKYSVEIELPNRGKFPLKAGMFATARLDGQAGNAARQLVIPRKAVTGSLKAAQVYVLKPGNTVELRNIEVDDRQGSDELVVLNGLQAGETVVTTGQINLQDGKPVQVLN